MKFAYLMVASLVLGLQGAAQAQTTDPCDPNQTLPTTYQVRRDQSVRVAFCHTFTEDDGLGTPIPLGELKFKLMNATTSQVVADLGFLMPVGSANAFGYYYLRTPARTFPNDMLLTVGAEYRGVLSVADGSIRINVKGGPKAPAGVRAIP